MAFAFSSSMVGGGSGFFFAMLADAVSGDGIVTDLAELTHDGAELRSDQQKAEGDDGECGVVHDLFPLSVDGSIISPPTKEVKRLLLPHKRSHGREGHGAVGSTGFGDRTCWTSTRTSTQRSRSAIAWKGSPGRRSPCRPSSVARS